LQLLLLLLLLQKLNVMLLLSRSHLLELLLSYLQSAKCLQ